MGRRMRLSGLLGLWLLLGSCNVALQHDAPGVTTPGPTARVERAGEGAGAAGVAPVRGDVRAVQREP